MKISLVSDLHLEFGSLTLPGGEILILAGDICEAKSLDDKRRSHYRSFFEKECAKYDRVIYVMGNHEHYNFNYELTQAHLQKYLPSNITLLENDTVEINGITFIGATLWTDANKGNPVTMRFLNESLNDFRYIKRLDESTQKKIKLNPEYVYRIHQRTVDYLKSQLADSDKRYIVVTHHAPCTKSINPHYVNDFHGNGGYASDLSDLILDHPQILVWHHGHMHDVHQYQIGDTWVMCNPRGYKGYEKSAEMFKPQNYSVIDQKVVIDQPWDIY